jgi:FkbM family methyltransferase
MKTRFLDAHVLAFEPVPQIFDLFRRNLALHKIPEQDVDAHAVALGATSTASKTLTYFPNAPGNSTFVPEEKSLLRKALPEALYQRMIDRSSAGATPVDVPLERLWSFLDRYPDLKQIDLLKVDVESWELAVLQGLDDRHWKLIRNAAVEVSELSGLRDGIEALLKEKGFSVDRQLASWSLKSAPVYTIVAKREE